MISMKDYAEQKHISYEAVRKQVVRYKQELNDHVFKQGRTQYLDDYAIDFLEQKRSVNPVIIYEMNKDEEIASLREENNKLLRELTAVQKQLLEDREKLISLETAEEQKQLAIAAAVQEANKLADEAQHIAVEKAVEAANQKAQIEKSEAVDIAKQEKDKELETVRQELEAARQELERPIGFIEWFKTRGKKG